MQKQAYLVLENGAVFKGKSFGYAEEVMGEVVFTTSMSGYLETLTDPSYYGQIVVQTFPLIGNYGIIPDDFESKKPYMKAYIVRQWCQHPSNFRSEGTLDTFLKENKIVGLYGIDTRRLTKMVRESGVMNGKILYEEQIDDKLLDELKQFHIEDAVGHVTCDQEEITKAEDERFRVVLWDFGTKENIRRELLRRGCSVIRVPSYTSAERVKQLKPDGIMLSNGPGDPAQNMEVVQQLKIISEEKIPTFGICLGHQLLALSQGAHSEKLKYGHRGENQPAVDTATGRVYITCQNHGYALVGDSLPDTAYVSYKNANDGTCEGVGYKNMPAFTVQFHPEAAAGPLDTGFLFDRFIDMMKEGGKR